MGGVTLGFEVGDGRCCKTLCPLCVINVQVRPQSEKVLQHLFTLYDTLCAHYVYYVENRLKTLV